MPSDVALTVIVSVQGVGGRVWKQVPAGVAGVPAVVGLNSSDVTVALVLSMWPASTRGGPSGGVSREAMEKISARGVPWAAGVRAAQNPAPQRPPVAPAPTGAQVTALAKS